jgi:hypothetical protein
MPRIKKLNRANARNADRQRQAWELYRAGANGAEIGRALGISRQHANRLLHQEREAIRRETHADIEEYKVEELERTNLIIREATRILTAACRTCEGRGRIRPDGPATLPGEDEECDECAGTGRRYGVDWRLKAKDRILKAVEIRAKLRGLYEPNRVRLVDEEGNDRSFYKDLESIPTDELDRELTDLLASVTSVEGGSRNGHMDS